MSNFYLELIEVVNETFKESFDRRTAEAESEPLDGEDRIRSYVCVEVEEAIRMKLTDKYQKRAIKYEKALIEKLRKEVNDEQE
jgi:hypothetical protein